MGTKIDALPAVMTEQQVAELFQVSRTTVGRLGRTGQIRRLVIGRSVRYRARDVLAYVDQGASERKAA
ncbi:helix-turn-helix domain-containing protein [Dietzia sp. SLG510A3-3B2-2]|nr:helix-turn-helix domain-containing protein [Dietzia sp. SLG510A3-40A3]MBB1010315.1 helix-turn-helix domain-containing protein [Dietzia sp. SLG510A3-3B2-2]